VVAAILLVACSSDATAPDEQRVAQPTSDSDPPTFVRRCESAVVGDANLRNAVTIGPLTLVGVREAAIAPPSAFRERHGRFAAIKLLAIVRGADDVTVTVPPVWREHVALLYDPAVRANSYGFLFSVGDSRVTFESCPGMEAQYNGGFLATRPDCVRLRIDTDASDPTRGWISLGAGRSSCPK
jgi:hypothetical protein